MALYVNSSCFFTVSLGMPWLVMKTNPTLLNASCISRRTGLRSLAVLLTISDKSTTGMDMVRWYIYTQLDAYRTSVGVNWNTFESSGAQLVAGAKVHIPGFWTVVHDLRV